MLVSLAGAAGHPALGTSLAAGLVVSGGLALAAQPRTAPSTGTEALGQGLSPAQRLLSPTFVLILAINIAIGIYFGAIQVSVTAFATEQGSAGSAATLYAVSSAAGLFGGWLFGLRTWRAEPSTQLLMATAALALAAVLSAAAGSFLGLALALGLAGLAVPLILVLASVLTERHVGPAVLTQAFTWLNSASAAGSATAAAIAGFVIDAFEARGGFGLAATAAMIMTLLAASVTRVRNSSDTPGPDS